MTTGLAVAAALQSLFPEAWDAARYDRLLVNRAAFAAFRNGGSTEELVASWQEGLAQFAARRPHGSIRMEKKTYVTRI